MKKKSLILLLLMAFCVMPSPLRAQDLPEYRMEIGVGGGVIGYLGDFNGNIIKNIQPAATIAARYNMNSYTGFKLNLTYGKLKGKSTDVDTYYPEYAGKTLEFSNPMIEMNVAFEYNLVPYGTGREYRGAKRLAPYITMGLGANYIKVSKPEKRNVFTANVPLGLGLKYKIGDRTNLGVEWAMHFSLSDRLDGVKDPYSIKSSGIFKNTDCYSTLLITASYSFMEKCRVCHNEYE